MEQKPEDIADRDGHASKNDDITCARILRLVEAYKHDQDTQYPHQRRHEKRTETVAFATLAIVTVYTFVTVGLWCAQRDANETNARNLIAANRAWLGVRTMGVQLPLSEERTMVQLRLKNFGRSPATHVVYSRLKLVPVAYIADGSGGVTPQIEPNATCQTLGPTAGSFVAWPDEEAGVPTPLDESHDDHLKVVAAKNRTISLIVQGCVSYQTIGEEHTSPFQFLWRDTLDQPYWEWRFNRTIDGNDAN
jgi:hypothetical protein